MNVLFPDDIRDRYSTLNVLKRQKITTICDKHFLRMIRKVVQASNRWQAGGRRTAGSRKADGTGGREAASRQVENRRQAGKWKADRLWAGSRGSREAAGRQLEGIEADTQKAGGAKS